MYTHKFWSQSIEMITEKCTDLLMPLDSPNNLPDIAWKGEIHLERYTNNFCHLLHVIIILCGVLNLLVINYFLVVCFSLFFLSVFVFAYVPGIESITVTLYCYENKTTPSLQDTQGSEIVLLIGISLNCF